MTIDLVRAPVPRGPASSGAAPATLHGLNEGKKRAVFVRRCGVEADFTARHFDEQLPSAMVLMSRARSA
jgi:hypothetical protein